MRPLRMALMLGALFVLTTATADARIRWTSPKHVIDAGYNGRVAVDGKGAVTVAGSSNVNLFVRRRTVGGTWLAKQTFKLASSTRDLTLGAGPSGHAIVAWMEPSPHPSTDPTPIRAFISARGTTGPFRAPERLPVDIRAPSVGLDHEGRAVISGLDVNGALWAVRRAADGTLTSQKLVDPGRDGTLQYGFDS